MGMTTSVASIGQVLCVSDNLAPATPWHVRIEPRAKVTVIRINPVSTTETICSAPRSCTIVDR